MCKNAQGTAVNLMTAIEPTIKNLLTVTGVINTSQGAQVITYYDAALEAVKDWKSGTPAQEALQAITLLENALPLLPIPAPFNILVPTILAGVTAVIGVLNANSPAPSATEAASPEEADAVQAIHAHAVSAQTESKVSELSGYVPSNIDKARAAIGDDHMAAKKYSQVWNGNVEENNLPPALKV